MFCEKCGHALTDNDHFCGECGFVVSHDSVVGKVASGDFPRETQKWNWGAALLTWIWALGNKSYGWALIGLLLNITVVGWIVAFFLFGFNGSEWAWRNRKWENIGHFQRIQRAWRNWGIVMYLAFFLIGMFFVSSEETVMNDAAELPAAGTMSDGQGDPVAEADYDEGYKAGYVDGRGANGTFGDSYSEPATEERKDAYLGGYLEGFMKGCREGGFDCSEVERLLEEESKSGTVQLIPGEVN